MRLPSVDLDDQPVRPPEEVDLESVDLHVHLGLGKAVAPAEGEHPVLEFCASAVGFEPSIDWQAKVLGLTQGSGELRWGKEGP